MTNRNRLPATVGNIALAIGAVAFIGINFLILFFTTSIRFFGSLNDASIALAAVLAAWLAWRTQPFHRGRAPRWAVAAMAAAVVGAAVVTLGAALVISATTGYYLAALYMTLGNAFIGFWLLAFSRTLAQAGSASRALAIFGQVTGAVMMIGCVSIGGILMGVDSPVNPPWHVNLGNVGALGWFLLFPIWSIWYGFNHMSRQPEARLQP